MREVQRSYIDRLLCVRVCVQRRTETTLDVRSHARQKSSEGRAPAGGVCIPILSWYIQLGSSNRVWQESLKASHLAEVVCDEMLLVAILAPKHHNALHEGHPIDLQYAQAEGHGEKKWKIFSPAFYGDGSRTRERESTVVLCT